MKPTARNGNPVKNISECKHWSFFKSAVTCSLRDETLEQDSSSSGTQHDKEPESSDQRIEERREQEITMGCENGHELVVQTM